MTMNEVIEYIDGVKPNAYSTEHKYKWLNTVEGLISRDVRGAEVPEYELPDDADMPLLVESPFDDLYWLYVSAMIDFYNREYNDYNNVMLMFQERLEAYKAWYIRTHNPSKANNFRNVMG